MNDFTVLHLSDLHIDNTDGHLSVLLKNLLEDIKVELEKAKHVVIVVTGDIVHQGNYRTRESVKRFFKELKNILEKKICKVFIVPGNQNDEKTYGELFFMYCEDIQDMDLTNALRSLMALFVEHISTFSADITSVLKSKVTEWIASQTAFIQALFGNICWESLVKYNSLTQHLF